MDSSVESKKKKKNKKTVSEDDPTPSLTEIDTKPKKKKSKKHDNEAGSSTKSLDDPNQETKSPTVLVTTSDEPVPQHVEEDFIPLPVSEKKEKSKKRKKPTSDEPEQNAGISEPPKKKKKKDKSLPDPSRDSSLTPQGQKALVYAFTHIQDRTKWKFHKARQNWLIRNYWCPTAVPDIYLPTTVKYLAQVQGGAHDKMVKKCTEKLAMEDTPTKTSSDISDKPEEGKEEEKPETDPVVPSQASITRKARAGALLEALNAAKSEQ